MVLLTRNETPTQVMFIRLGIIGVENREIKSDINVIFSVSFLENNNFEYY